MNGPDLSDRTVLVTGSARGLGREVALAAADRGARVAVHYHTSGAAAEAVAEEAAERGVETTSVRADVTDPESVDALFETVERHLGPVDGLVNNVGDFAPVHWRDLDLDTWHRVLDTNLTATYLCSKRALPTMAEREFGRIVNVGYASSEKGLVDPVNFPYFVAKAGVIMFTRMLAADTADDGITVNAVSPYVIENSAEFPEELPRDRPASFDDVVRPIMFFVDPANDYVSGENLEVHGGWLPEDV